MHPLNQPPSSSPSSPGSRTPPRPEPWHSPWSLDQELRHSVPPPATPPAAPLWQMPPPVNLPPMPPAPQSPVAHSPIQPVVQTVPVVRAREFQQAPLPVPIYQAPPPPAAPPEMPWQPPPAPVQPTYAEPIYQAPAAVPWQAPPAPVQQAFAESVPVYQPPLQPTAPPQMPWQPPVPVQPAYVEPVSYAQPAPVYQRPAYEPTPVPMAPPPAAYRAPERPIEPPAPEPPAPLPAALLRPSSSHSLAQQHSMHERISQVMSQQNRQRMNTVMALSISAFILVVFAFFYLRDEAPPVDADLQSLPPQQSPTPPRAVDRLKLALETSKPVVSTMQQGLPPWEWDDRLLSETMQDNATASDHWRGLINDDDWQPQHPAWATTDYGSLPGWEALQVSKAATVAYYARRREEQQAFDAALEIATVARRLQTLHTWPTMYPHCIEMHERASEAIAHFLRTTQLDAYHLGQLQLLYERNAPSDTMLRDALNRFYQYERRLITGPRAGDLWDQVTPEIPQLRHGRLFFKPNTTLQDFATCFRGLKNEVVKVPYARSYPLVAVIGPPGMPDAHLGSPNITGRRYANERLWSYGRLVERQGLQITRHQLVLALFGVRRFVADTGRLPKTLSELTPHYFTELPIDPCNGEPLHYDPVRGIIWSVGMDWTDAGGHLTNMPLSDGYEPTVSVK